MSSESTPRWEPTAGLIRAVQVLGRPWTILVISCLLDHPRRFSEIVAALPGISTNLLSERLKTLTELAIITRTPTETSSMYALTKRGRALQPVVGDLSRWGSTLPTRTRS